MKPKKIIFLILFLLVFFMIYYYTKDFGLDTIIGKPVEFHVDSYVADMGEIKLYFCPREECETAFVAFLDSAQKSIHCALFEIDLKLVQEKLLEKSQVMEVKIVTDNGYLDEFNHSFVKADSYGLMHNKFCIIDGVRMSTGSMNPTDNCAHKNNNNLLLINSTLLSANYEAEFQEMWNGTFKKGNTVLNPKISLGNTTLESYFCPEDHCAERVKEELKEAEQEIYFMTFSFTEEGIANILMLKHLENLTIKGIMEVKQISQYSQYNRLMLHGINVLKDGNKYNLHHKVFIIDNSTVVTGSFNPTNNGDKGNDENVLIIHDKEIAQRFLEEFGLLWEEAESS